MTMKNPFNLPIFDDAYEIEQKQYIRLEMSGETALYAVFYPSGMFKRDLRNYEVEQELERYVPNKDFIEHLIRYTTEWRRVHFYPDSGEFFSVFPNGQEFRGGAGNHTSFGREFIWKTSEED